MVEWKKIGEICTIIRGNRVTKSDLIENGLYPVISGGVSPLGYIDKYNREPNTITIAQYGSAGYVDIQKEKFWANDVCYSVYPDDEILNKFLFYSLKKEQAYIYSLRTNAVPAHLPQKDLAGIRIPIPSLDEQNRIVGILDTFTASIDNLKEQIAQRRKQYEYYRDQLYYANKADLLEASKRGDTIVKSLEELGTFTRGRRFVRTDIVPEGVPCIHYGDMYTYYGVSAEETPTHLTKELSSKLRFAKYGDVVIVAAGENDLDIGVGVAWLGNEPVVVHDACFIFEHKMNPKYLSHFMRSRNYHQQIRMGVVDGKICSISAKELGRALIAVPSLQEQQRIVSILDTFEASIQNLEAQLSQREKQYEYYRNKLLTFE